MSSHGSRNSDTLKASSPSSFMEKIRIEHHTFAGGFWFAMRLFTIGFLKLNFVNGVLALLLWPYFLGAALSKLIA